MKTVPSALGANKSKRGSVTSIMATLGKVISRLRSTAAKNDEKGRITVMSPRPAGTTTPSHKLGVKTSA